MKLLHGECLDQMRLLESNSIDAIVTDPPYGLAFMGKKWDCDVPSKEIWTEALRVLKPGGHLLSFGGTRTYHRMVVNIEDAGFEIRDQIQWLYGSGFPKSHNIKEGPFKGFGTALKPANEPICLARKPLDGTVARNIEKWGVGGINIDGCRIGTGTLKPVRIATSLLPTNGKYGEGLNGSKAVEDSSQGRWPANLLLDETAAEMLDEQSGILKTGGIGSSGQKIEGVATDFGGVRKPRTTAGSSGGASRFFYVAKASKSERNAGLNNSNKPSQNHHPTVKPIKLMEYLCKLITPPNGTILDPFMGSGTTGIAAKNLGFKFVGIEMNEEYFEIAKRRIG